jgi:plastocyanin
MTGRNIARNVTAFAVVAILVVGGASLLVVTAPARASSAVTNASSGAFSVTAVTGFAFTPDTIQQLPTGTNISVTFTDGDTIAHTFSILNRQGVVIPPSTDSGALEQLFTTYGALFSHNLTSQGAYFTGNFTAPASPGWYEFVCLEPGHFESGMYGFIAFGMNLPGNLTVSSPDTNPGLPVFIIVGTIVGLVVIAIVLGFVYGRRRGSTYEMPPERLGYPEPEGPLPPVEEPPPISDEPRG